VRDSKSLAFYLADDTRIYDLEGNLLRVIDGEAIALAPDLSSVLSGSTSKWSDALAFKDVLGKLPSRRLEAEARPIVALQRGRAPDGKGLRPEARQQDALVESPRERARERAEGIAVAAPRVFDIAALEAQSLGINGQHSPRSPPHVVQRPSLRASRTSATSSSRRSSSTPAASAQ